jgi:hypothetical protein
MAEGNFSDGLGKGLGDAVGWRQALPMLFLALRLAILVTPVVLLYTGWHEIRYARKEAPVILTAKELGAKAPADALVEITHARLDFKNACPVVPDGGTKAREIFIPLLPADAVPGAPFAILLESTKPAWLDPAKATGGADITIFGETTTGDFLPYPTIDLLKKHYGAGLPAGYVVLHEHLRHHASTGYTLIVVGLVALPLCWLPLVRGLRKTLAEAASPAPPQSPPPPPAVG